MSPRIASARSALRRFVVDERWPIAIFVAALVVRLHWNLVVHPPGDYLYSDMDGYVVRADGVLRDPWTPREYAAFYPWGPHVLLALLQLAFGHHSWRAAGAAYAVMGALVVLFGFLLARRVSRARWVAPAVGLVLVLDYPLVSLGGYFLSEIPFAVGMVAATWLLVRLVDEGNNRDAWLAGVAIGFAVVMRPQILLSVAFVVAFWLVVRRFAPDVAGRLRFGHLVRAGLVVAFVLAASAVRLHHHTGRLGLVSENASLNEVFGRCHNMRIVAMPDGPNRSRTTFEPPPLLQLNHRATTRPDAWPQLDPLVEQTFFYYGYIGDTARHRELIGKCLRAGGWRKQVEFAAVHVLMLWRFNVLWPDSGKPQWQGLAGRWGRFHAFVFAIPAALALLVVAVPRRHPKLAWVALHGWAVVTTAVLVFGDVRLRTPYDPFVVLLALEGSAMLVRLAWSMRTRRSSRNPGNPAGVEQVAPAPRG